MESDDTIRIENNTPFNNNKFILNLNKEHIASYEFEIFNEKIVIDIFKTNVVEIYEKLFSKDNREKHYIVSINKKIKIEEKTIIVDVIKELDKLIIQESTEIKNLSLFSLEECKYVVNFIIDLMQCISNNFLENKENDVLFFKNFISLFQY